MFRSYQQTEKGDAMVGIGTLSPRSCLETYHCQSPTSLCVTSWMEIVIFRSCDFGRIGTVGASDKLVTVTKSQVIKSHPTTTMNCGELLDMSSGDVQLARWHKKQHFEHEL